MILDTGICAIYRATNNAAPGAMPVYEDVLICQSWYGELNFETAPVWPTERREDVRTDARIRILQNRAINNHDVAVLDRWDGSTARYRVTRAYHGVDGESGEPITDLSLEVMEP